MVRVNSRVQSLRGRKEQGSRQGQRVFPGPEPECGGGEVAYQRRAGDGEWRGQRLQRPRQGEFGPYPIISKRELWKVPKAGHDMIRSERYTHIHTSIHLFIYYTHTIVNTYEYL